MAKKKNRTAPSLEFLKPFGPKHRIIFNWWKINSKYSNHNILICDGAIRSGKSVAIVYSFLLYTQTCFKNVAEPKFAICGQTVGAVKRNIIDEIFEPLLLALNLDYRINLGEGYVQVGKCKYYIFGCPDSSADKKIQGMTLYGAIADEVALYNEEFFRQLKGRHSGKDDYGRLGKIFCSCNPLGPQNWFKINFIDPAVNGLESDNSRLLYLKFLMEDNILALGQEYIDDQKSQHKGVFYKRNILGEWCIAEGLCYSHFTDENIVKQLPRMIDYYVGGDGGDNHPTTFVMIGKGVDGNYYMFKEYKKNKQLLNKYANDLKGFISGYPINPIVVDSAASSLIREINAIGIVATNVNKSALTVANAIGIINTMFGNKRLFVHESCKEIIKELYTYSWDKKAAERGEDKVIKENDDLMDAFRYALMEYVIKQKDYVIYSNISIM